MYRPWLIYFAILTVLLSFPLPFNRSFAQTPYLDSLKEVLPTIDTPSVKAYEIYRIGFLIRYHNVDSAFTYAKILEDFARENNLPKDMGRAYDLYSLAYQELGEIENSMKFKEKQLEIWEDTRDSTNIMYTLKEISDLYFLMDQSSKSMEILLQSIAMAEQINNRDHLGACYNSLGDLYSYNRLYDRAMEYFQKAIEIRSQDPDTIKLYYSYGSIGDLFLNIEKYDSAIVYSQKALDLAERYDRPGLALSQYNNIGFAYLYQGELNKAQDYFSRGLELAKTVGRSLTEYRIYMNLAHLENLNGNYQKALNYALKADTFSVENNLFEIEGETALHQAHAYAGLGNYQAAYEAMLRTYDIKDSLIRRENLKGMADLEVKYDTGKKEEVLAQQSDTITRQKALQKNIIIGSLIALLLLGGIFQYLRYRQRIKARESALALELEKTKAKQLEELDTMRSNFFANISHEFRTPLSLIHDPLNDILDSLPASAEPAQDQTVPVSSRLLGMMQRNAARLGNLVDQLLDLSKLESGKMQLTVKKGNILPFIRALVYSFESLAERKNINLQASFPDTIPEAYFDRDKLEKIIVNLLSNAFKFTPKNGSIEVIVQEASSKLRITFRDSGIGMPTEEVQKIFDRFYQVEGTEEQGTGIGLSLVKEMVDLYRGEIRVESTVGVGTSFYLTFPYRKMDFREDERLDVPQEDRIAASSLATLVEIGGTKKEVPKNTSQRLALIVEDNEDLRHYIAEILGAEYRILMATDGQAGQQLALQHSPDIIISDVMMPKMDGFTLCETLKKDERTSHIPIILLTAKAGHENKLTGLETGADDYLTKPFNGKELQIRARNLIEVRQQLRAKFKDELLLRPEAVSITSADERFLQKVKDVIEANLGNEQFSVEDLANAVAFSRSQLHRKLKAVCDQSPNELIRGFRLTRAKELLEKGAGNVSEVSVLVGYNSVSYFTRSFKQAFGVLPSEV